jgi:hypothetical protein
VFCLKIDILKEQRLDHVVWDETQESYIAKLLPYASSLSGPIIEVPNVNAFKKKGVDKVSQQFQAELNDLQQKIASFVSLASDTQEVYSASFKFEPIIGKKYHLYQGKKEAFLSLIPPHQWKKEHLGSFCLNSDYKWVRL